MKEKIIRDLVHGYIEIDEKICKIIDHPSFQRLKNICQLTAHHLYPSANHTRFEHSLGVMHLADQFFKRLKEDVEIKKCKKVTKFEITKMHINLKLAALLHDVGHGPFSHLGEQFYDNKIILKQIDKIDKSIGKVLIDGSKHEFMSCFIILHNFRKLLDLEYPDIIDYELICRIITGNTYDGKKLWYYDILVNIVNSDSIDVDKLDYLMRDNHMCGYVAPKINYDRLLLSLIINTREKKLSIKPVGLSSLVSFIDSRDMLYLWVYNHHTVVYTDFLYKIMVKHLRSKENKKSKYKIKRIMKKWFSPKNIAENYLSDNDIKVLLNNEYINTKSKFLKSEFSKIVLSQIIERKFLKPIWKTIYDYNTFMHKYFQDDRTRERIETDINRTIDDEPIYIKQIVKCIINKTGISHGEIFLIQRSNKFYSMSENSKFYININSKSDKFLDNIFPERKFENNYSKIAFYIFTKETHKKDVQKAFIKIMNNTEYK